MSRTIVKQVPNARLYSDGTILFQNVRFSYVHADEPWAKKEGEKKKFSVTGLMPKATHRAAKDLAKSVIDDMLKEKKIKAMAGKDKFLRDGDDSGRDEYMGMFTVNCSETKRPSVRGPDTRPIPLDEIRERVKSGYYGDILVRPWFQDNEHGKKVNAGFVAIQVKRGTAADVFGDQGVSEDDIDETFDEYDDDESGFETPDDDDEL